MLYFYEHSRQSKPCPSSRFLIGQYVTVRGDVVSHVNVSRVRVEDGGQYACAAANRAGRVRHAARLNVYGEFQAVSG